MKMFAVVGKPIGDLPGAGSWPEEFYRTYQEAFDAVERKEVHSRGGVITRGFDAYKIVEVERDSHPCCLCGQESTAKNPDKYPYCRMCHYTGRAEEHLRADQMAYFRKALAPANVDIAHTGGGCMALEIVWPDVRKYLFCTDGDAFLPTDTNEDGEEIAVRGGWGYVGVHYGCEPQCMAASYTDPTPECDNKCCEGGQLDPLIHWMGDDAYDEGGENVGDFITDEKLVELALKWAREQGIVPA